MWSAGALLNNGQHKSLTSRSKRGSIQGLGAAGFPCSASRVHYEYITFPFLRLAVSVLCRAMSRRVNAPSLCTAIRVDRPCITIPLALAAYYSILCIILHYITHGIGHRILTYAYVLSWLMVLYYSKVVQLLIDVLAHKCALLWMQGCFYFA